MYIPEAPARGMAAEAENFSFTYSPAGVLITYVTVQLYETWLNCYKIINYREKRDDWEEVQNYVKATNYGVERIKMVMEE